MQNTWFRLDGERIVIVRTCLNAKMGMAWNATQLLSSCFTRVSSYQLPADLNARLFEIAKVYGGGTWGAVRARGGVSQGFEVTEVN